MVEAEAGKAVIFNQRGFGFTSRIRLAEPLKGTSRHSRTLTAIRQESALGAGAIGAADYHI
jgi:hypothetical protein